MPFELTVHSYWNALLPYIYTHTHIWISEKAMAPHSSALAWKIPWREEPGRLQSMGLLRVRHDWATLTFHFPALEKEMATHSSVLAWRIPGTAGPGGLPSIGSHRVRHNWSDLAAAAVAYGSTHISCLRIPMNRGALWATVHEVAKSWLHLSDLHTHTHTHTHTLPFKPLLSCNLFSDSFSGVKLFKLVTYLPALQITILFSFIF